MNVSKLREIRFKLTRGLLDLIVLRELKKGPAHGYALIVAFRSFYNVYFGPSTIYPLLHQLEADGLLRSTWDVTGERPKKVYNLTSQGTNLLTQLEETLNSIQSITKVEGEDTWQ